ncbi:MAG: hypothetical protein D5R96_09355 [Methanocalculus sp. MSAO_Arc2]|uniref:hypothetical protein n=1 Tax=Methanocalculus sp. MSAO_Arc2 TaxID=2293855 RepID=UPI000FF00225|nr:MAG: hypothetical protein D5R96_09355 [Methanocalculus sp. MSAO_Arc2]
MKTGIILASLVLLAACCMPVAAEEPTSRYSYITFQSVDITLEDTVATVTVQYSIDTGIEFLVMLLGTHDLRMKLLRAMNFEDARIESANMTQAVIMVDSASYDYGDNTYWFPRHSFLVTVPKLTISTPLTKRNFYMIHDIDFGIGYSGRRSD